MNWRELLPAFHPLRPKPPFPEQPEFAFCETLTAGGDTPWHIRKLTARGKKLSGGADTPALCGRVVSWDLRPGINKRQLQGACQICVRIYQRQQDN